MIKVYIYFFSSSEQHVTYLSIVLLGVSFEEPCTAISRTPFCPVRKKNQNVKL